MVRLENRVISEYIREIDALQKNYVKCEEECIEFYAR